MRIISYNINGLNAFVKNHKLNKLLATYSADIYCFQEIKTNDKQLLETIREDYPEFYIDWAPDWNRRGYSGVMTMIRKSFVKQDDIPNISESVYFDKYDDIPNRLDIISSEDVLPDRMAEHIYSTGRVLVTEFKNFVLFNVYVPNSGNKEDMRKKFDNDLIEDIKSYNKPVIVCGDMNVCATELDYWGNYVKATNTMPGLMQFEFDDFNRLQDECYLIDAFRDCYRNDRKYSYFTTRAKEDVIANHKGWRLDYFLVSESIESNINDCLIFEGFQGRDHSPIFLNIDL